VVSAAVAGLGRFQVVRCVQVSTLSDNFYDFDQGHIDNFIYRECLAVDVIYKIFYFN
jgi:hypothetical protein